MHTTNCASAYLSKYLNFVSLDYLLLQAFYMFTHVITVTTVATNIMLEAVTAVSHCSYV